MTIDENKWQQIPAGEWASGYSKYTAIRINTTTGTAAFDPPTVEVCENDDAWICIYSGGNNGESWGRTFNGNFLALLGSAFEDPDAADLIAWLESNVMTSN